MRKLITLGIIAVVILGTLAGCYESSGSAVADYGDITMLEALTENENGARDLISEEEARERLLEMGWDDEWLDSLVESELSLAMMYNQSRFSEYAQLIYEGIAIGESGEVIAPRYFGGLKFDDDGFLVVSVLPAAFSDPTTAAAIEEMREKGIIIRHVEFTQQDITATIDRLNDMHEDARAAGASSWGQGADNGVSIWLDPYNDEQKAIFNGFLLENGFDTSLFIIQPAVTQEMLDHRAEYIERAAASMRDKIVHTGEADVSRTGIAFTLKNTTDIEFNYGSPWDLAHFENGRWQPVTHLPGAGSGVWVSIGFSLQGGGIQQYRQNFEQHFGTLPPGRYLFIRDGWLGEWNPDSERVFAVVEFEITEETPLHLPPAQEEYEWPTYVEVVEVSDISSTGMRIVVENSSPYDIDHRVQVIFVVPAEHTTVGEQWEWFDYHIPFISFDDIMQGHGLIPAGERREFYINLGSLFGEIPPGDYKINLSIGGQASPPHPTGWALGDALIEFTVQ